MTTVITAFMQEHFIHIYILGCPRNYPHCFELTCRMVFIKEHKEFMKATLFFSEGIFIQMLKTTTSAVRSWNYIQKKFIVIDFICFVILFWRTYILERNYNSSTYNVLKKVFLSGFWGKYSFAYNYNFKYSVNSG